MYNIYIKNYNAGNGVIETEHLGVRSWFIDNELGYLVLIYNEFTTDFISVEQVLSVRVVEIRV